MVLQRHFRTVCVACLLITGCSLQPTQHRTHHARSVYRQPPEPRSNDLPNWTRREQSTSRAPIGGLIQQAHRERQVGNLDHAEATLERALRVAPRDASTMTELAEVKLALGRRPQARALANKSNGLVRDDPKLKARNDHVISATPSEK